MWTTSLASETYSFADGKYVNLLNDTLTYTRTTTFIITYYTVYHDEDIDDKEWVVWTTF